MRKNLALLMPVVAFAALSHAADSELDQAAAAIRKNAETYYPAIAKATGNPPSILIGFIVDHDMKVLRHSAGFKADGPETVKAQLDRMFPGQKTSSAGGACFGVKASEPNYCVAWGEARE